MFKRKRLIALVLCALALFASNTAVAYESLSYLYGGTNPVYTNNIARTRGNLTMVMADYFHINADGNAAFTKTPDQRLIQAWRAAGVRVVAYVSNHWNRDAARKAMGKRASVAATLAGWVRQYGLDGLDVDIENLTEADRDSFTDFFRLLRQELPANAHLSAAVAANPHRLTTGWQGQYDYVRLSRICDHILIMTYDQSYEGGAAGPVASYAFTEASVKEALKHIPKEKLLMGIPFYGRYWATLNNGDRVEGKAFTVADIETLTAHHPSAKWYDPVSHCARASMTVRSGDSVLGLWGGKKLEPGVYDIWYENDRSYAARMELCRKYGLAGVGSWALGQEPQRIWNYYRTWLNGVIFSDIVGHWCENAVYKLYDRNIVTGTGNGLYMPAKTLSRAEAVVLVCKMLGIPETDPSGAPEEIRRHWGAAMLNSAILCGLMTGDGTSYRPADTISRAEMTALCAKALNAPNTIDFSQRFFTDVSPGAWYNNAVVTMSVMGFAGGMSDGLFHPEKTASRAEAAELIWKIWDADKKDYVKALGVRRYSSESVLRPPPEPPVLEPR